jgi:hypothetical protein
MMRKVRPQEPKKPLTLKRALDFMRSGSCLLKQASTFYVVPGGLIDDRTALAIQKRPDVWSGKDGLWPGHDQTWRLS